MNHPEVRDQRRGTRHRPTPGSGVALTPILTPPWVTAALDHATAPFLLVGGTANRMWAATLARRLSPHLLEIDGATTACSSPARSPTQSRCEPDTRIARMLCCNFGCSLDIDTGIDTGIDIWLFKVSSVD